MPRFNRSLAWLVVSSFGVRILAWGLLGTGTIESEGAEYARIAQNLLRGVGYVGLVSQGPQVLFPPLLPLLIAGVAKLTNDTELAGRLISLCLCSLLPLPVFGIAARLFDRRVGWIAAALALLHPILVHMSFMVYSEGPYATLLLASMYFGLRALQDTSLKWWLLMGVGFALCYLMRAEGFAAFVLALGAALLLTQGDRLSRLKRATAAGAVFGLLALPEVIYIHGATGKIALEAKSSILFSYTGQRVMAAERNPETEWRAPSGLRDFPSSAPDKEGGYPSTWQEKWAILGLNSQLEGTGFCIRRNSDIARSERVVLSQMGPLLLKGIKLNLPTLITRLTAAWMGPLLPALAFLGAVRRVWRRPKATARLFILIVSLASVIATFFVLWNDARYYFIFVPLLSIWAAAGVDALGAWAIGSAAAAGWGWASRSVCSTLVPAAVVAFLVLSPARPVYYLYQFYDSAPVVAIDRQLGVWLGEQQKETVKIMDLKLPLTFHANALLRYFPYCDGDVALRYLDAVQVDYLVLRRGLNYTKYYDEWLTNGIPDPRAERVQLPSMPGMNQFVVYRWRKH